METFWSKRYFSSKQSNKNALKNSQIQLGDSHVGSPDSHRLQTIFNFYLFLTGWASQRLLLLELELELVCLTCFPAQENLNFSTRLVSFFTSLLVRCVCVCASQNFPSPRHWYWSWAGTTMFRGRSNESESRMNCSSRIFWFDGAKPTRSTKRK